MEGLRIHDCNLARYELFHRASALDRFFVNNVSKGKYMTVALPVILFALVWVRFLKTSEIYLQFYTLHEIGWTRYAYRLGTSIGKPERNRALERQKRTLKDIKN
jgi:hypothetical protein